MSKRKITLLLFAVMIVLITTPFFVGRYFYLQYQKFLTVVSELNGVTLEPLAYEEHWWDSKATTRLTLKPSLMNAFLHPQRQGSKALSFLLEHEIHHGPLIKLDSNSWMKWSLARALIRSRLILTEESKKQLETELGTSELIKVESRMALLDGVVTILLEGSPMRSKNQSAQDLPIWGGIQGNWSLNAAMNQLQGELDLPAFTFSFQDINYQGKGFRFQTERNRIPSGFWTGSGSFKIEQLVVDHTKPPLHVQLDGLEVVAQMMLSEQLIDSSALVRVLSFQQGSEKKGPLDLSVSLRHIPEDVVNLFTKLAKTNPQNKPWFDHFLLNPELVASLPRILSHRPELVLDRVHLETTEGILEAELAFAVGGAKASNVLHPAEIIQSIVFKLHSVMPKRTLEKMVESQRLQKLESQGIPPIQARQKAIYEAAQKVQRWIDQGYFKDKNTVVESVFEYEHGAWVVNGVKRDLPSDLFD